MDTRSEWLGRQALLIRGLLRSLKKHAGQGWLTEVPIPGRGGSGRNPLKSRLGFLAARFLSRWHQWNQTLARHNRFWGKTGRPAPGSDEAAWARIDSQGLAMAGSLLRDSDLGDLLAEDWMGELSQEDVEAHIASNGTTSRSFGERIEGRVNLLIKVHHLLQLARHFDTILRETGNNNDYPGQGWQSLRGKVETWNAKMLEAWPLIGDRNDVDAMPLQLMAERAMEPFLLYHGGYYAYSSLLHSWLAKDGNDRFDREAIRGVLAWRGVGQFSGLEAMVWGGARMMNIPWETLSTIFGDNGAPQWLDRVARAVSEMGFATFAEAVAQGSTGKGGDGFFAGAAINVIPGGVPGDCERTLVAVARGIDSPHGFDPVMRRVREHLIACPVTKSVVVICDHWHPEIMKEHRGDLRAHHAHNNVQFLFLLAGTPRNLSVVAVNSEAF
jgi:hypothetical protein